MKPRTCGRLGIAAPLLSLLAGCSGSSAPAPAPAPTPVLTSNASIGATALTFPSTVVGASAPAQTVTLTSTGTGALSISSVALGGANAGAFTETNTCAATLAPGAACSATLTFTPIGSGAATATLTFTDNAPASPQTVTLTGTGSASAASGSTADCSVAAAQCPALSLLADPIAPGGFHGYADPSMRKDPNSTSIYFAYSWAHTLADGTHVVDLHLASSNNGGASFTYVGPLYQSTPSTQTATTAYSSVNDSSTETIDLLPIPLAGASAGQTLWVQAHQSYLVKPQSGIYDQLDPTSIISVSAVQLSTPAAAGAGTALLALSTAPEARLGAVSTDPSRNITQPLASLSTATAKCGNFGQAALWYQTGTLYLALECSEITGNGNIDSNELAHFLYATTPTGADASKWTWTYSGEFATPAQAAKLGSVEGTPYTFFTEPEFALGKTGQLLLIATPSVFAPAGSQQPVIQYGCRVFPVTSLGGSGVSLPTDATTGALVVSAKITESDLYTGSNEGPAACTYEPAASNGIVIGRKFENDPALGFYIYPVNTGIFP